MKTTELQELTTVYDSRKSFYGKAKYRDEVGGKMLYSYDTCVACITPANSLCIAKDVRKDLLYSPTTIRHIKEFFHQFANRVLTTKEIKKLGGQ